MHSIDDLSRIVHVHYPRGTERDDPGYEESGEYRRLVAARKAAAEGQEWRALLRRMGERFPADEVLNRSLHLGAGHWGDAAYSGRLFPAAAPELTIGFFVSFLVPCYIVYSTSFVDVDDPDMKDAQRFVLRDDTWVRAPIEPGKRQVIQFDFSPALEPYAAWLAPEIEAAWGYERMPPDVGRVIVPNVATNSRRLGEATIYDCLMSDDW